MENGTVAAGVGASGARPRTYTDEYRRQVVDLVVGAGRSAMSVGTEFGIHQTPISRWVRRYRRLEGGAASAPRPAAPPSSPRPSPVPHADQAAEIARLKRGNEQLRRERDILRKGIAIFAAPSR